jgi:hypothetical protein
MGKINNDFDDMYEIINSYTFDINAIMDFVNGEEGEGTDTQINDTYEASEDGKLGLTVRNVTESKLPPESQLQTMRYDLIKLFIGELNNMKMSSKRDDRAVGGLLILHTFMENNFLKKINKDI